MRSGVVWATWGYATLVVLGVLWVLVDDYPASRATASGLVGGASVALVVTALAPRHPLGWAPALFAFATVALGVHLVGSRLAELEQPGSTLGGSGTDLILLLLLVAWPVGFVLTVALLLRRPSEGVERDGPPSPLHG
ncbi:hypothetical protein AVL62_12740 [Serinicoccus chungangensis]|uniref:Uncharacterized protein n=1 Tax=Serinicoccus chungangensis TaxID=767452 RepID=A0A0W8I125_9MICO|nr:hypothetical protein [Serinicoccus chungangensis]KUG51107.1 hypothetical protein AVL62_12740 [Serinicoccus chungangensis]